MRNLPDAMREILAGGPPFTGEIRPQTRITALQDWYLNTSSGPVGARPSNKLPIRWYQDNQYSQFANEVEIPNLKQVVIDRQLLQGAATIQVEIYNTLTPANGEAGPNPDVFGDPGYYAYARGFSSEGNARWNYAMNEWSNVLRDGCILHVYQGYGGEDLDLADAIAEGFLILDGVFNIDTVAVEAQTGLITLTGRDMGKLLVDQVAWPPLVPQAFYGLGGNNAGITYYLTGQDGDADPAVPGYDSSVWTTQAIEAIDADGSTDPNASEISAGIGDLPTGDSEAATAEEDLYLYQQIFGSATNGPSNATDGNTGTFWLSPEKSAPGDYTYIEFACGSDINGVNITPYLGGCMCFVSVMENGEWVGSATTVDPNGGTIPYVTAFGLGPSATSTGTWYPFPATYTANAVRLTFTNLQSYQGGYYAAIEEVLLGNASAITANTKVVLDMSPTPDGQGYTVFGSDGGTFNYGDARYYGSLAGTALNGRIIGGEISSIDGGYWMCGSDGGVFTYGNAGFYGSLGGTAISAPIVGFRGTPSLGGYYMVGSDGAVYAFGDAAYHGRSTGIPNIVDIAIRPQNDGYWLLDADGGVYTYGSAGFYGTLSGLSPDPVAELNTTAVGIDSSGTGEGYRIATALGGVYCFGDAVYFGPEGETTLPPLNAPISGIRRTPTDNGFWLVAEDGGVFTFGNATFYGSLPGAVVAKGNYADYSDIVTDFLLWAGFWLYPQSTDGVVPANALPQVYGNIETTGAYNSVGPLQGIFDKLQIIDCIKMIEQIVGYIFRVDEQGAARFQSPNWWSPGNFYDDGTYTTETPVLDEKLNLNDYTQTTTDQSTLSEIIVAPEDPYLFGGTPGGTTVTRFTPAGIGNLHGLCKPAMLGTVLNVPITVTDQEVMAELLAIQCYFASRQGQAIAIHNPAICVDDQIQIFERSSGEANVHYVVGVHTEHDLDSGQKLATYSTYWLGSSDSWVINANQDSLLAGATADNSSYDNNGVLISDQLINFLANTGAKSVQQLVPGATAPTLINPGGAAATSSDILDPTSLIAEGLDPTS